MFPASILPVTAAAIKDGTACMEGGDASVTYTVPVKDWPSLTWSHRRSDDALATCVTIDSATDDTLDRSSKPEPHPSPPHLPPPRLLMDAAASRGRAEEPDLS